VTGSRWISAAALARWAGAAPRRSSRSARRGQQAPGPQTLVSAASTAVADKRLTASGCALLHQEGMCRHAPCVRGAPRNTSQTGRRAARALGHPRPLAGPWPRLQAQEASDLQGHAGRVGRLPQHVAHAQRGVHDEQLLHQCRILQPLRGAGAPYQTLP